MANIYVRSTDGSDADNGSTWALAKATITGAAAIDAAGDTIYVSQSHAESTASAITFALAGTLTAPTNVICGNDGAEPPTAVATTGSVTTTGASSITITGVCYVEGIAFRAGNGSSSANIVQASLDGNHQIYNICNFVLVSTNINNGITPGSGSSGSESSVKWKNCDVKFAAAGQSIKLTQCRFHWQGGSLLSGGTSPTNLIAVQADQLDILVENVDLSNASAGINLFSPGALGSGKAMIRNCKLPASWSGSLGSPTAFNTRLEMHNCDATDTNYRLWVEDYAGSIKSETTVVCTGGASDGTTPFSFKMATSSAAEYPAILLESIELPAIWNDTTGSSKTVTVEFVHDSVTNLTDAEIWLEVSYLGTAGVPLGTIINDAKADVLATAADQADSSAAWTTTGLTNPNTQKLSVTFTPEEKGYLQAKVIMAKASYTAYIDPRLTVS